jgi:hypothetical protein
VPLRSTPEFSFTFSSNILLLRSTVKNFPLQIKLDQEKPYLILAPEELAPKNFGGKRLIE